MGCPGGGARGGSGAARECPGAARLVGERAEAGRDGEAEISVADQGEGEEEGERVGGEVEGEEDTAVDGVPGCV